MLNSVRTQLHDKYGKTEVDAALHYTEEPIYEAYVSNKCLGYSDGLAFRRELNLLGIHLEDAIDKFVGIRRDSLGDVIDA